jgi:hypothetical protein
MVNAIPPKAPIGDNFNTYCNARNKYLETHFTLSSTISFLDHFDKIIPTAIDINKS